MANLGFAVTMQNFLQRQRDILRTHVAELRKYAAVLRKYVAAAKEKLAPFKNFIVRAFELSKKFAKCVWYKGFLPFLGYHHILMILIAIAIILLSLLLAGCSSTSPLIPGIFLISMYYKSYTPSYDPSQVDPGVTAAIANIVGNAILEVRVGYFGICVNPNGGDFLCSNNATALAEQINVDQDPLNLIWVASTFKDSIVFPYLLIVAIILAFITFILLATFPGWHQEEDATTGSDVDVKPFPSRPVSQVALALIFISSIFVLVSVLWQHTASVAAATVSQDLGNGSIKSGVGTASMVLGWFGFVLLIIVTIGLLVMILSIIVLDKLTDG